MVSLGICRVLMNFMVVVVVVVFLFLHFSDTYKNVILLSQYPRSSSAPVRGTSTMSRSFLDALVAQCTSANNQETLKMIQAFFFFAKKTHMQTKLFGNKCGEISI